MLLTRDQIAGASFLAARRVAYLADVPGLGKTAQYIRAIDLAGQSSALVLGPPAFGPKLPDEVDKWSLIGHDVTVITSGADSVPYDGIVFVSYALATQPRMLEALCARKPGPVIFDEAHALKEPEAKRTQACLGVLAQRATHVWMASGTPAPNHAGELFPFCRLAGLWPGSFPDYVAAYCTTKPDYHDPRGYRITGSKNIEALKNLIAPAFLRRTHVEGRPPLSVDTISVSGSDAYASLAPEYADTISDALARDDWSFADLEHVSTVRRLAGVAKVPATIDLARAEMESGHKRLLIFGTHILALGQIAAGMTGLGARLVNGSTSNKDIDGITRHFQSDSAEPLCIVGNMQTLGEAITLTAASRLIIFEPSWTPKDNEQVIARAWRRGQTRPVHASFIALAGSIDDAITRTVARKTKQIIALLK